ncbi:MAG: universal stress protein [Gemmatimonadaceae bacterium]|nr:universal stress protein [Gemmatimonadaceae bacterium]NUQ91423.1 universal stress protein [Gemmatimonadaceae bacterium]NUR20980.1 universal stress protein [Gemmatimonadaceae bacterium]
MSEHITTGHAQISEPFNATAQQSATQTIEDVTRRILVPTDGSRAAGAALRIAAQLGARTGGTVAGMTVFESLSVFATGFVTDAATWANDPVLTRSAVDRIERQLRECGGDEWKLHVEFGSPATEIVRKARAVDYTLIVIGLGKHAPLARAFGAETTMRVMRRADVPVLAVDRRARRLPHTAVVAADLGPADLKLARTALALMERPALLHLVHVRPEIELMPADAIGWDRAYEESAQSALEKLARQLEAADVTVRPRVVAGSVAERVTAFAYSHRAGLIAAGRRSRGAMERLLMGSSATQIVRAADCSVLVAGD